MSDIELAKKLRRVRKFMLENAARWEALLPYDPSYKEAIEDARRDAHKYLLQLRELKKAA